MTNEEEASYEVILNLIGTTTNKSGLKVQSGIDLNGYPKGIKISDKEMARGYVKQGLEKLKIPYAHTLVGYYTETGSLYHAFDLYLVTSRQEGAPKAVLESMATRVPLITTRVGRAMDLVQQQVNGWMVEPEDVDTLAHWSQWVLNNSSEAENATETALKTAAENSYPGLTKSWSNLLTNFISPCC